MTDHAELRRLAEEVIRIERSEDEPISSAWELFDSAANPKTILAMLDEIDGLLAQHGRDSSELRALCQARDDARKERDRLKAENAALRQFAAEAYQVLGALDAPENVLDNASDAASGGPLRHETLLPFFAEGYEALRKDAERYRAIRQKDRGGAVIRSAGNLQQPAPAVPPPITGRLVAIAVARGVGVVGDGPWVPGQALRQSVGLTVGAEVSARPGRRQAARAVVEVLHQAGQLAAFVADLGEECRRAHQRGDTEPCHPAVQRTNKNAGARAGIREDLQQLLLSDRHSDLQAQKSPHRDCPNFWGQFRVRAGHRVSGCIS